MKLIGLIGFAQAGKDTVCQVLREMEPNAVRYAFADELKQEVATGFNVTPLFINENKAAFRELLQAWGVTKRYFNPDYWVGRVAQSVEEDRPQIAVVTDVRFQNEAEWIKQAGGILVRVTRPGLGAVNGHVSEHELADYPTAWVIENKGTIEELRDEVANFWEVCVR